MILPESTTRSSTQERRWLTITSQVSILKSNPRSIPSIRESPMNLSACRNLSSQSRKEAWLSNNNSSIRTKRKVILPTTENVEPVLSQSQWFSYETSPSGKQILWSDTPEDSLTPGTTATPRPSKPVSTMWQDLPSPATKKVQALLSVMSTRIIMSKSISSTRAATIASLSATVPPYQPSNKHPSRS